MSSPISPVSGPTSPSSSTTTPTASPNADVDSQTFLLAGVRKVERPSKLHTTAASDNNSGSGSINGQSSMTTSAGGGAITSPPPSGGGGTGSMATSPSFLPEMPQWKRDLIQRRKANAARTAVAVTQTALLTPSCQHHDDDGHDDSHHDADGQQLQAAAADKLVKKPTKTQTSPANKQKTSSTAGAGKGKSKPNITASPSKATSQNAKLIRGHSNSNNNKMPATSPTKTSIGGGHYTMEHEHRTATTTTATDRKDAIAAVDAEGDVETEQTPIPKQRSLYSSRVHTKEQQQPHKSEGDAKDSVEEFVYKQRTASSPTTANAVLASKFNGGERWAASTATTTRLASSSSREHEQAVDSCSPRLSMKCGTYSPTTAALLSTTSQSTQQSSIGANTATTQPARCQSHSKHESERTSSTKTTTASATATTTLTPTEALSGSDFGSDALALALKIEKTVINPTPTPKISTKLQNNQFIKNQQQQLLLSSSSGGVSAKLNSKFNHSPMIITSPTATTTPTATATNGSPTKTAPAFGKKKMVAVQEMKKTQTPQSNAPSKDFDPSEDLSYGPGIVSKLRCRYLSLALRESMEKERHCLDNMRRATSLNNLLDRCDDDDDDDHDDDEVVHDETDEGGEEAPATPSATATSASVTPLSSGGARKAGILKNRDSGGGSSAVAKKTATFEKNDASANGQRMSQSCYGKASSGNGAESNGADSNRSSRQVKRGNDSLKRARSVEALLCERSPWNFAANRSSLGVPASAQASPPTCVTIEDKIHNARERMISGTDTMPPKRLTSIIDDTERPPPDLVKQTLKLFEASANKRGRGLNRGTANGKGEVATKVANYKSIIKEQKPPVVFPKPSPGATAPPSPTKKPAAPAFKPVAKPVVAAADLLSSPIGRKTLAVGSTEMQHSTPRPGSAGSSVAFGGGLSEQTPDIIPRHKLVAEAAAATVDSPLTALSKKLEKLSIESNGKEPTTATTTNTKKLFAASNSVGGVAADDGDAPSKKRTSSSRSASESSGPSSDSDSDDDKSSRTAHDRRSRSGSYSLVDAEREGDGSTADDKHSQRADIVQACAGAGGPAVACSSASDQSDDDEYGRKKRDDDHDPSSVVSTRNPATTAKHITQTALDNIAKAGTTQQFKFGSQPADIPTSATGKQIGVIRPLNNTAGAAGSPQQPQLTSREIEKNRINEMKKSSAAAVHDSTASALGSKSAAPTTSLDTVINTNTGKLTSTSSASSSASSSPSGYSELDAAMGGKTNNSPLWALRKKRPTPPTAVAENTSMVFNFSNRKEVPDYIENDGGVIYRRKRELPKPNESGFVLLNDLALDTSTDTDYDDFSMCPPSPCDVEFENANIVIDGKSSIRQKTKDSMFRVQFNDTLTSTFEYPSEASLIVEDSFMNDPFFASAVSGSGAASANKAPTNEAELISAYENLSLEDSIDHAHHHHVAVDEIIPIPQGIGGAAGNGGPSSPSKNILGSLPLDFEGPQLVSETSLPQQKQQQQQPQEQQQPIRPARHQNRKALAAPAVEQQICGAPYGCFDEMLKLNGNGRRNHYPVLGMSTMSPPSSGPAASEWTTFQRATSPCHETSPQRTAAATERDESPPQKAPRPTNLPLYSSTVTLTKPPLPRKSEKLRRKATTPDRCAALAPALHLDVLTDRNTKQGPLLTPVANEDRPIAQRHPLAMSALRQRPDFQLASSDASAPTITTTSVYPSPRKPQTILNKPQYACFLLQQQQPPKQKQQHFKENFLVIKNREEHAILRTRSNEFLKIPKNYNNNNNSSHHSQQLIEKLNKLSTTTTIRTPTTIKTSASFSGVRQLQPPLLTDTLKHFTTTTKTNEISKTNKTTQLSHLQSNNKNTTEMTKIFTLQKDYKAISQTSPNTAPTSTAIAPKTNRNQRNNNNNDNETSTATKMAAPRFSHNNNNASSTPHSSSSSSTASSTTTTSLPLAMSRASNALLSARIPGNTLYYV